MFDGYCSVNKEISGVHLLHVDTLQYVNIYIYIHGPRKQTSASEVSEREPRE
jgi:hypothetical protein